MATGFQLPGWRPPRPVPPRLPAPGSPLPAPRQTPTPQGGTYGTPETGLPIPGALPRGASTFQPPTFQPDPRITQLEQDLQNPVQDPGGASDPQIASLIEQLRQQAQSAPTFRGPSADTLARLRAPLTVAGPNFAGIEGQAGQLQGLIAQLLRGEGINVGSVANDAEAVAYRNAATRQAERARESEAARLGASGVSGSGDFDARLAGIQEATGQDIAGFEAGLTGRRRAEMTGTALQGANLSLADLDRQTRNEQARYEGDLSRARLGREGELAAAGLEAEAGRFEAQAGASRGGQLQSLLSVLMNQATGERESKRSLALSNRAAQQDLLNTLLGEQGRVQGIGTETAFRTEGLRRDEQIAELERQLRQQEIDRGTREAATYRPPRSTAPSGGFSLPGARRPATRPLYG